MSRASGHCVWNTQSRPSRLYICSAAYGSSKSATWEDLISFHSTATLIVAMLQHGKQSGDRDGTSA